MLEDEQITELKRLRVEAARRRREIAERFPLLTSHEWAEKSHQLALPTHAMRIAYESRSLPGGAETSCLILLTPIDATVHWSWRRVPWLETEEVEHGTGIKVLNPLELTHLSAALVEAFPTHLEMLPNDVYDGAPTHLMVSDGPQRPFAEGGCNLASFVHAAHPTVVLARSISTLFDSATFNGAFSCSFSTEPVNRTV